LESQAHMGAQKEDRMTRIVSFELGCGDVAGALYDGNNIWRIS